MTGMKRGIGMGWRIFVRQIREMINCNPPLAWAILAALLLRTMVEGYGLILLVPVFRLMGLGGAASIGTGGSEFSALMNPLEAGISAPALLLAYLALVVVRSMAGLAMAVLTARLQSQVLHGLRTNYHAAIGRARWSYLVAKDPAQFTNGLTAQPESIAYGVVSLAGILSAVFTLLAGVAAALVISWSMTLLTLGAAALMAVPLLLIDIRFFRLAQSAALAAERLFEHLGRRLGNLKMLRVQSADGAMQAEFERISLRYSDVIEQQANLTAGVHALHEIAAAVILIGLAYWAVVDGNGFGLEPAVLTVIFARLVPRVHQLQSCVRNVLQILPYYGSYREILDEIEGSAETPAVTLAYDDGHARLPLKSELRFDHAGYRYASRSGRDALRDISLSIISGTATGVIGLNGAGKTTLLDLAAGLLNPTHGRVLVDGADLAKGLMPAWRRSVAYVLQEDALLNDTILANLKLGAPEASEDDLWEALELAWASELVRSLPQGLHTNVGDRGQMLSRGQRQRLCIARALISRPALLLMDEGTSALNPIDEQDLSGTFRGLLRRTTIIAVSHRPSALAWVDRLLVLEEGRVSHYAPSADISADPGSLLQRMARSERRIA